MAFTMIRTGFWLLVFGLLSLLLPRFGYDLYGFEYLGEGRSAISVVAAILGVGLMAFGLKRRKARG